MTTDHEAASLARRVGAAMLARDNASRALGMELVEIGPGRAIMAMRVREDMLNGHATCHGGIIFALADSCFAFACNSDNHVTVAAGAQISLIAPARLGDLLRAEANEVARAGRTGVFDVEVRGEDGALIAVFRGNSHRTRGNLIESP